MSVMVSVYTHRKFALVDDYLNNLFDPDINYQRKPKTHLGKIEISGAALMHFLASLGSELLAQRFGTDKSED